jgi:hypothetical protein
VGTASRKDSPDDGRHALIFLDFAPLQTRQCKDKDYEKWYARSADGQQCLMGHKVCFSRRRAAKKLMQKAMVQAQKARRPVLRRQQV